jgi:PTH1 family peptidyl-tRNA hydrolase
VHGRYNGLDLVLVKPTTYMNLSGVAVRKVLARQRAPLEDLLVVVDDFDLPLGRIRLRAEGSAGTHNGLKSIVGELGNQKFARLRVGIGEPLRHEPERAAMDHVLSRFGAAERHTLGVVLDAAADAVEDWARDGAYKAANRWNAWTPPTEPIEPTEADASAQPNTDPRPQPDEHGIVRHSTGWRRLLRRG